MGASKLWDLIRDIEKRHHAKKATRLGLETILERVNTDIASYFGSRLTESHERTVLIDLSGSLSELQSRQRDAIAAKTLVEHDHAVALELTRLDWIRGKLDRCRARYGCDAKLVVFADHPDTRTIEKLEQLRTRYESVAQQLTRELAGEIAATGRPSTHRPDPVRPEELEQPVLDNDRSNEDDVEEPAPDNAGEHDAELEVEVVSRTSRTRGNRVRAAARTAKRAAKIAQKAEKGGGAIDYHGFARIVWERRQKRMPPIQLPTEADTHHPDARISSLASFLLDQATFVQATREADQA
ncbi:uncharacterized protein JCM15063_003007, partial [Sporobolomyces koalae]|uniref:uncharacterized protein n=1 Tax=Sporobolomyces koalae TaxID=500713 RepID=UPI00317DFD48